MILIVLLCTMLVSTLLSVFVRKVYFGIAGSAMRSTRHRICFAALDTLSFACVWAVTALVIPLSPVAILLGCTFVFFADLLLVRQP